MHDWGSNRSSSPVFQPTPVCSPNVAGHSPVSSTAAKNWQPNPSSPISPLAINQLSFLSSGPNDQKQVGSDLELVREEEEDPTVHGLGIFSANGSSLQEPEDADFCTASSQDLDGLKKELSSIIRQSRILMDDDDIPDVPNLEEALNESGLTQTPALSIEKKSGDNSPTSPYGQSQAEDLFNSDDEDAHSEFSFEEEVRMGRSTSVEYHKRTSYFEQEKNLYTSDEEEYIGDYDFDSGEFLKDDGHLFGVTPFESSDLPYMHRNQHVRPLNHSSIARTAPLRVSTAFSDASDVDYASAMEDDNDGDIGSPFTPIHSQQQVFWHGTSTPLDESFDGEDDDNDDYNYNYMLDEVNAVPSDSEINFDSPVSFSHTLSLATPSGTGRFSELRKAKTYGFERQNVRHELLKRHASVIKVSDSSTITLFSSPTGLSKKSSTSSSDSLDETTLSTSPSSFSSDYLNSAEIAEMKYGSFLHDLPQPFMPPKAALTPISERSYDSDYSTSRFENRDLY